jgi:predicted alpha/beta superfamily hydrolase
MPICQFYFDYPPKGRIFIITLIATLYGLNAYAKPDMSPLGPNIADRGSAYYHFNVTDFDSLDGDRHYKVWTAIPNTAPPAKGYPILYTLDGNAVMDRLSDTLLKKLTQKTPPVIVAIGYQTNLPFDQHARAYDYRPKEQGDPADGGWDRRKSGGSEAFRQRLENTILEKVEHGIVINPQQRAIWGHSYGDYSSLIPGWRHPVSISIFLPVLPWGGNSSLLAKMAEVKAGAFQQKSLYLMEGAVSTRRGSSAEAEKPWATFSRRFPAEGKWRCGQLVVLSRAVHGEMFSASLYSALLAMSGFSHDADQ